MMKLKKAKSKIIKVKAQLKKVENEVANLKYKIEEIKDCEDRVKMDEIKNLKIQIQEDKVIVDCFEPEEEIVTLRKELEEARNHMVKSTSENKNSSILEKGGVIKQMSMKAKVRRRKYMMNLRR